VRQEIAFNEPPSDPVKATSVGFPQVPLTFVTYIGASDATFCPTATQLRMSVHDTPLSAPSPVPVEGIVRVVVPVASTALLASF
jgi:hypothetical protein